MASIRETLTPLIRELEAAKKAFDSLDAKKAKALQAVEARYAEKVTELQARVDAAQKALEIAVRGEHTSGAPVESEDEVAASVE